VTTAGLARLRGVFVVSVSPGRGGADDPGPCSRVPRLRASSGVARGLCDLLGVPRESHALAQPVRRSRSRTQGAQPPKLLDPLTPKGDGIVRQSLGWRNRRS
jgi:hypothetical protein